MSLLDNALDAPVSSILTVLLTVMFRKSRFAYCFFSLKVLSYKPWRHPQLAVLSAAVALPTKYRSWSRIRSAQTCLYGKQLFATFHCCCRAQGSSAMTASCVQSATFGRVLIQQFLSTRILSFKCMISGTSLRLASLRRTC